LAKLGYEPGRNIEIVERFAEATKPGCLPLRSIKLDFHLARGRSEAIPGLAAELMKTPPDIIIGDGVLIVRTLKNLATTVPIVGILGPDPVAGGLVASLARWGGYITGVTTLGTDLHSKRAELLNEAIRRL
jgi:putative tryptophan/tyrosine transport system substrate-binding protein